MIWEIKKYLTLIVVTNTEEEGKKTNRVDLLLLLMHEDKFQFVLVRNLELFLRRPDHSGMKQMCRKCFSC